MKRLSLYVFYLLLAGCSLHKESHLLLHYDLYRGDSIVKRNAVQIEYDATDSPDIKEVKIFSKPDSNVVFKERMTDTGLLRSIDNSEFQRTHAFGTNEVIVSTLPKSYPIFLNTENQKIKTKSYELKEGDSLEIIYFGEDIPAYTITAAYYSRKLGFFILFYDPWKDTYLKIAGIDGEPGVSTKSIVTIADKITQDTSFFFRFLKDKLPHVPPPLLKN